MIKRETCALVKLLARNDGALLTFSREAPGCEIRADSMPPKLGAPLAVAGERSRIGRQVLAIQRAMLGQILCFGNGRAPAAVDGWVAVDIVQEWAAAVRHLLFDDT